MISHEIYAIFSYIAILLFIGFISFRKNQTESDFILGGRGLNYWLTALAAHASDMSSWLFLGYPALIYASGLGSSWVGVGLIIFMFLNWQLIAPKIRVATEYYNSMTFSSFFESRFGDTSGLIRIFTAILSFLFFSIYISSGLIGLGILIESLFHINYILGITIGMLVVIPYLFIGGYRTLAYLDLFQGLFLMVVILIVPLIALGKVGGLAGVSDALQQFHRSVELIPSYSPSSLLHIFFITVGWGLGYFGQPHIITKFMGIKNVAEMYKSKYIGMTWQCLTLIAATCIGLIGVAFFSGSLSDPQLVFVKMVHNLFPPYLAGFVLCAVLAATISTMDSQILVLASSLAEDFYKRVFRRNASSKEILWVSRLCILLVAALAYLIAFKRFGTIFNLVSYAWFGLGSTFGPLLIFSLYSKKANKYGAWAGILLGGGTAAVWPYFDNRFQWNIPTLIPAFLLSCLAIWLVSYYTRHKHQVERLHEQA
ncbi:MAG: sodium/proline symporter PutP [Simkaniaceae bacterium]